MFLQKTMDQSSPDGSRLMAARVHSCSWITDNLGSVSLLVQGELTRVTVDVVSIYTTHSIVESAFRLFQVSPARYELDTGLAATETVER